MASLNKCMIIGNVVRELEQRFLPNGNAVCNFSVATSETWKDANGMRQEKSEFHSITMYGKLAEVACKYLKKGSQVYLEGKINTRKWQDKQTGADRYTTEIIADEMKMLGGKPSGQSSAPERSEQSSPASKSSKSFDDFEDCPF